MKHSKCELSDYMLTRIIQTGLPEPVAEYQFDRLHNRKWRFDHAWVAQKIACEYNGATWVGGRHVTGVGYERDRVKMNAAVLQGWRVFEFTTSMIHSDQAIDTLVKAFEGLA